jgi:hypothetical protein
MLVLEHGKIVFKRHRLVVEHTGEEVVARRAIKPFKMGDKEVQLVRLLRNKRPDPIETTLILLYRGVQMGKGE